MAMGASRNPVRGGLTGLIVAVAAAGCGGSSHPPASGHLPHRIGATESESTVLALAAEINAHYPRASASQQTHPAVTPSSAGARAMFTLKLTSRQRLGPHGLESTNYKLLVGGRNPRCAIFAFVEDASAGEHLRITLHAPLTIGSWCTGPHPGVVLLQTTPHCPPPTPSKPQRCRLFATRSLDAGRFKFLVR